MALMVSAPQTPDPSAPSTSLASQSPYGQLIVLLWGLAVMGEGVRGVNKLAGQVGTRGPEEGAAAVAVPP